MAESDVATSALVEDHEESRGSGPLSSRIGKVRDKTALKASSAPRSYGNESLAKQKIRRRSKQDFKDFDPEPPQNESPRRFQAFLADLRNHSHLAALAAGQASAQSFERSDDPCTKNFETIKRKAETIKAELADLVQIEQTGSAEEQVYAAWHLNNIHVPRPRFGNSIPRHFPEHRRSSQSSSGADYLRLDQLRHAASEDGGAPGITTTSARNNFGPPQLGFLPPGAANQPEFFPDRRLYEMDMTNRFLGRFMPPRTLVGDQIPPFPGVLAGIPGHIPPMTGNLAWNQEHSQIASPVPNWIIGQRIQGNAMAHRASHADVGDKNDNVCSEPQKIQNEGSKRKSETDGDQGTLVCHVCQREVDVTDIKRYIRCRKICNACRTALTCFKNGQPVRYCQLCSWVHPLEDFDGDRRSCRAELKKHNERRRRKSLTSDVVGADRDTNKVIAGTQK